MFGWVFGGWILHGMLIRGAAFHGSYFNLPLDFNVGSPLVRWERYAGAEGCTEVQEFLTRIWLAK
jgi:hypothetical protein